MHPALSIIVFTTLSGLGYGLAAVLGLGLLDPAEVATKVAWLAALAMIAVALLSSTLHLGNPQRAWRAFSQWRSSWLSREGVLAVVTFVPLSWSAIAALWGGLYIVPPALLGSVLALVTVYCTAMIYASLKSVQAWHTPLTPACYLLFSLAGGFTLTVFFAAAGGGPVQLPALGAVVALVAAWGAKLAWRNRKNTMRPRSTPETATGLGQIGRVRLFERPHINDNYLTREMGYTIARKHAAKLAALSLILGGAVPLVVLLAMLAAGAQPGIGTTAAAFVAVASHATGMLIERCLFFAEARHAVMNYYGG